MKNIFKNLLLTVSLFAATPSLAQNPIDLRYVGRFYTGSFDQGATEICAFDPVTQRLFSVNGSNGNIDIINLSDPAIPSLITTISLVAYGGKANSIDFKNGILAAAVEGLIKTDNGKVIFFDASGNYLNQVTVGALPDMLTFTPNGNKIVVACEGEPNSDYSIDPVGVVAIIDSVRQVPSLNQSHVTILDFAAYNTTGVPGVRSFGPNATFAQDMEPEYVAISRNSQRAWITLQENNAMAEVNLTTNRIVRVWPLGFKDHSVSGNGMDVSDRSGSVQINTWPVKGMYQPDAAASYNYLGQPFIVTANEGDARDYTTFVEAVRMNSIILDSLTFPNRTTLRTDAQLGRLNISKSMGDTDGDGDFDELYSFGARSFSIWNAAGQLVFDSGDMIEQYTASMYPTRFNASNSNNTFKNRSDDKGPEPEGLTLAKILGRTYLFLGLERIGGVMTFDITDPYAPVFVDYINTRDFTITPAAAYPADLGPEGLLFIPAADSPNGRNLLLVSNEISGSIAIFETDYACGNLLVSVCNNGVTECINQSQLNNYLASGATLGSCTSTARLQDDMVTTLSVSPNPAGDYINVRLLNANGGSSKLMITDVTGRVVNEIQNLDFSADQNQRLSISELNSGWYHLVLIQSDGVMHNTPIVVSR
ncbi:MAG: choice-of-anchor I family protein [Bacteroidota bacterium]|jgi:2',3'-cyclic-nucleotide 2'-phosphodiesterase/3'-nucleotidase/5'-nucleotidase